ncbi:hypothetical protein [Streptomyces sp. NPDC001068]|uniref:hypothetical protein n=1 Tax=Streptomyces sp. NPDC001068 TaxID=3364544 RepID=UPI00368A6EAA
MEAAIERWHVWDLAGRPGAPGRRALGVDVARTGGDSTVLCHRRGLLVASLETHDREDTMQTTARVQAALGEEDGAAAVVDSIGVGGGVVDRLRELGAPVLAYTGAAQTKLRTRDREWGFFNVRSAAYWKLRELLDPAFGAELALPPDDLLVADLTTLTWDITTGVPPKIKVEKKEDVVDRLGRSPDRGDSVAMSLFADHLSATKLHAPGGQRDSRPSRAAARYARPTTPGLPATKTGAAGAR